MNITNLNFGEVSPSVSCELCSHKHVFQTFLYIWPKEIFFHWFSSIIDLNPKNMLSTSLVQDRNHFQFRSVLLCILQGVCPLENFYYCYVFEATTKISRLLLRGPWGRQHQSKYSMLCMTTLILVWVISPCQPKKKKQSCINF